MSTRVGRSRFVSCFAQHIPGTTPCEPFQQMTTPQAQLPGSSAGKSQAEKTQQTQRRLELREWKAENDPCQQSVRLQLRKHSLLDGKSRLSDNELGVAAGALLSHHLHGRDPLQLHVQFSSSRTHHIAESQTGVVSPAGSRSQHRPDGIASPKIEVPGESKSTLVTLGGVPP